VLIDERRDTMLPELVARAPDCTFLRDYESLCWRFGKTPPPWRTRPAFWRTPWDDGDAAAMRAVRSALLGEARDVRAVRHEARRRRDGDEAHIRNVIAARAPEDLTRFERMLEWTRYWTQALNDRHGVTVGLLWERELIWRLGLRLSAEGLIPRAADVLLLRVTDLTEYAWSRSAAVLACTFEARAREYRHNRRIAAPEQVGGRATTAHVGTHRLSVPTTDAQPGAVLSGTGFGRGHAAGRARILRSMSPATLATITSADILVVLNENAFAYADWHSLLMVVRGVVAAARPAHHLTQVAREVGVPVVGQLGPAISRIEDGSLLRVDAERGLVYVE